MKKILCSLVLALIGVTTLSAAQLRVEVSLDNLMIGDNGIYFIVEDHDPIPVPNLITEGGKIYAVYDIALQSEDANWAYGTFQEENTPTECSEDLIERLVDSIFAEIEDKITITINR